MELIKSEDILFDWSVAKYLNYTHIDIVDRICDFFTPIGNVDRIEGEVFLCRSAPNCITLDDLPSNMVMRPLSLDNVKAIHDLYPANEIESFQVFERLIEKIPGYGIFTVDGELAAWMVSDNSMKFRASLLNLLVFPGPILLRCNVLYANPARIQTKRVSIRWHKVCLLNC